VWGSAGSSNLSSTTLYQFSLFTSGSPNQEIGCRHQEGGKNKISHTPLKVPPPKKTLHLSILFLLHLLQPLPRCHLVVLTQQGVAQLLASSDVAAATLAAFLASLLTTFQVPDSVAIIIFVIDQLTGHTIHDGASTKWKYLRNGRHPLDQLLGACQCFL
jgi:hypothetical protein